MPEVPHIRSARTLRWPLALDGAVDGAVVFFALWTLWYQAALILQFDLRPSGWPFLVLGMACVGLGARRGWRGRPADVPAVTTTPGDGGRAVGKLPWVVVLGLSIVLLLAALLQREDLGALPIAVLTMAVTVAAVALRRPARSSARPLRRRSDEEPAAISHLLALAVSIGGGLLSLFVFKSDADDAFYVNRAAWVAEHGTAALRDTMFGPETYPQSFGGGLPTPSIEALQGVVAAMLGVEAGTVAYLLYAPVLASIFVWATWRLIRAWAPRRHLLVLVIAVLFVLASGASIVGNYSIGRIWQGKVMAYAVLLPLVWAYLSRLAIGPSRHAVLLLVSAGVAFVGLTTSSALMMPVVGGAALLAALVLRSRPLALGAAAFAAGPLINGLAQAIGSSTIGTQASQPITPESVFAVTFGPATAMVLLAVLATAVAPGIARCPAAVLAGAIGIATMASYLPGVLGLVDAVTGAGPVVWRLAIAAPTWVFVGLLAAGLPVGDGARVRFSARALTALIAPLATLVAIVVPIAAGHWIWSKDVGARLLTTPAWKVDPVALADVRAARELEVAPGLWLMPPVQMETLSISTAGPYAVVPRAFYLPTLQTSEQARSDREILLALVTRRLSERSVAEVRGALQRLDVAVACVPGDQPRGRRILKEAAGEGLQRVGTMRCHVRTPA